MPIKGSTLNVKLLRKIRDHILEEPKRVDMSFWLKKYTKKQREASDIIPACGTIGCIAGWAKVLTGSRSRRDISVIGAELLGLPYVDWWAADEDAPAWRILPDGGILSPERLFSPSNWDGGWYYPLERHNVGTRGYARVVAGYINYFIKRYGPPERKKRGATK